jgi:biotin synthase
MDAVTREIYEIVEKGLEGAGLDDEDTERLYAVDPESPEGFHVMWAGRRLQWQSSDGIAEVHAQVGLNSSPCPKNCIFCSFAVCNGVRKGKVELPKEDVVEYAKIYEEQGANAILLMATATYSFEQLFEMLAAVREVISPDLPLLANTGDVTLDQARQLKAAGADGCYHAVRMREGVDTTIPVATRLESFANLRAAGLSLSTCVEPVGPEHSAKELTEATRICKDSGALSAGVGRRIGVPGTEIYARGMLSTLAIGLYVAVYRLASGLSPRLNCAGGTDLIAAAGANLAWAEVGTNPRDTQKRTERGGRGVDIAFARKVFVDAGYEVLKGPSPGWQLNATQQDGARPQGGATPR